MRGRRYRANTGEGLILPLVLAGVAGALWYMFSRKNAAATVAGGAGDKSVATTTSTTSTTTASGTIVTPPPPAIDLAAGAVAAVAQYMLVVLGNDLLNNAKLVNPGLRGFTTVRGVFRNGKLVGIEAAPQANTPDTMDPAYSSNVVSVANAMLAADAGINTNRYQPPPLVTFPAAYSALSHWDAVVGSFPVIDASQLQFPS